MNQRHNENRGVNVKSFNYCTVLLQFTALQHYTTGACMHEGNGIIQKKKDSHSDFK